MALNLARLGAAQRRDTEDYDPYAEADARRRARREEQVAAMNLAQLQREAADADRKTKEDADTRAVMGQYLADRGFAQSAPIGVVNPRFLSKPEIGPQPEGYKAPRDTSSLEDETVLNLAKINPMTAEAFRKGSVEERQGIEDRTRRIAKEDRDAQAAGDKVGREIAKDKADRAFASRQQAEVERHNRAIESLKRQGIIPGTVAGSSDGLRVPKGMKVGDVLKARDAKANAIFGLKNTEDVAKRLLAHPGLKGLTGLTGFLAPVMYGTRYKDASAIKNQLKALAGFSALQEMRAASPTGGALGPVSDTENKLLQDSKLALENSQTQKQYKENLRNYIAQLQISQKRIEDAWLKDFGGGGLGIEEDPNDWEDADGQ